MFSVAPGGCSRRFRTTLCLVASLFTCAAAGAADNRPLGFEEALRASEQRSARLAGQQSAIDAASEEIARASELPDPKLRFGIENVPVSNPDAFTLNRDFMTMRRIGYMQDVPSAEKRRARGERAEREHRLEVATLAARRAQVREETALAWLDLHYGERSAALLEELVAAFRLEADSTGPAVSAGRMTTPAAVAARVAAETAADRALDQRRAVARARAALAAFVGDAAQRPLGPAPDINALFHPAGALVAALDSHPAQRVFEEREALAESEVALAASTRNPDWNWEVSFGQREPNFSNMVSVMVGVDLPFWKDRRQDREVAARARQLDQARANREDARRMHEAEIRSLLADWTYAGERAERLERNALPLARERSELTLAAYRGGRGELTAVLEARRAETDLRLQRLGAELERARAWARLNFLLDHGGQR